MRDAAEVKAERIFIRELRAAGLTEKALRERPRSESLKWKIARTMRTETTESLGWIARRLDLGSASNQHFSVVFLALINPLVFPNKIAGWLCGQTFIASTIA